MPGSSNTSFIPKHTPNKAERRSSPRQLFLGTLLVQILFFAVLIAAAATFFYDRHLGGQLDEEMFKFTTAASTYDADAEKLAVVSSMDNRLRQASDIFEYNVSALALFEALERATVVSAQFTSVDLKRENEDEITLEANIKTNTFDSTLFQRSIFFDTDIFTRTELEDVTMENTSDEGEVVGDTNIAFKATMIVDPRDIPALLTQDSVFVPVEEVVVTDTASTSPEAESAPVDAASSNEEAS